MEFRRVLFRSISTIKMDEEWPRRLASTFIGIDYEDWKIAVVVDKSGNSATIGFPNGTTGTLPESAASMPYRKTGSAAFDAMRRSEERRVGKECVRTCRSRWWPYQ